MNFIKSFTIQISAIRIHIAKQSIINLIINVEIEIFPSFIVFPFYQ